MGKARFAGIWLILAALALLQSCSASHRPINRRAVVDDINTLKANNGHAEALGVLELRYRADPRPEVLAFYRETAQAAKSAADQAYQQRDYAQAGSIYRALMDSAALRETVGGSPFDQQALERQVRECSKLLTERGLEKYREENLEEALAAWKKVLTFDPDNRSVLKAIDTASRQRKRLQTMN